MGIETYPTDEMGMPLSIVIPDPRRREGAWNRHHAWHYARHFLFEEHGATPGLRVVRFTKKGRIPVVLHDLVHEERPGGVPVPAGEDEEVKHALFNLAGRVSTEALKLVKGSIQKVELNRYDRKLLRLPGVFTSDTSQSFNIGKSDNVEYEIGNFLMGYVVKKGLSTVIQDRASLVGQFIELPQGEARDEQARLIVRAVAQVALSPWEKIYKQARTEDSLKLAAPHEPTDVIMASIKYGIPDLPTTIQSAIDQQLSETSPVEALVA